MLSHNTTIIDDNESVFCIARESILINAKVHMHQVLSHGSVNDITQIFQCPQMRAKTKYGRAARVKHVL